MRRVLSALGGVVAAMALSAPGLAQHTGLSAKDRALIDAASMQTVEVALAARVLRDNTALTRNETLPPAVDNKIVLRVPAAYLVGINFRGANVFNQGAPGAHEITFAFWSRSFDPVMTDMVPDAAECRQRKPHGLCEDGIDNAGRVLARRRNGEYIYEVKIHSGVGTEENRRFNIEYQVGLAQTTIPPGPCDFREDPVLGMLVGRHPDADRLPEGRLHRACGTFSNGALIRGKYFDRATFLKREADGSPRFGVRCPVFTGPGEGIGPNPCDLIGYFGIWPIEIRLPSDWVAEWDASFEKLRDFLAKHTVSRTD